MFLCRPDRALLAANAAARHELANGSWLHVVDGYLAGRGEPAASLFRLAFQRLNGETEIVMPPLLAPGGSAEIRLRGLAGHTNRVLLSLVVLPVDPRPRAAAPLVANGPPLRLSVRQRELAERLLTGASLDAAARQMGISRRTARDHLNALFKATGTHRQQDLLLRLSRPVPPST